MKILNLVLFIVSSSVSSYEFTVKSVFLTQEIIDSIFQTLEISPEEFPDSIVVKKLVDGIFDFFENKGIIDPEILVSFEFDGGIKRVGIEVFNERIACVNDVILKAGDKEYKGTFFKRHLLRNGIFLKSRFENDIKFLENLGLFPYDGYVFEKSPSGYKLVLKYRDSPVFPIFILSYANKFTNLYFSYDGLSISNVPSRYRIGFNVSERTIQSAQLQLKFPLSLSLKLFGTLAITHDSITLEKLSVGRTWDDYIFSAGIYLRSLNLESMIFSFTFDKRNLSAGVLTRFGVSDAQLFFASTGCFSLNPRIGFSFIYSPRDVIIPSYSGVNRINSGSAFFELFLGYKKFVLSRVFGEQGAFGFGFEREFRGKKLFMVVSKKDKVPMFEGAMITFFIFERAPLLDFMPDFN